MVSQTAHTQFTSSHRPYQASVPRSIQPGSKNDFTARPSSMIPYAAPRSRMLGHPVFHRKAVSRITRTPATYSQLRSSGVSGFNHSSGGALVLRERTSFRSLSGEESRHTLGLSTGRRRGMSIPRAAMRHRDGSRGGARLEYPGPSRKGGGESR